MIMEINEIVSKAFNSELGQQIDAIYSTSDKRVFIRKEEAIAYTAGRLDEHSIPLADKTILIWWQEDGELLSLKVH